MNWILDHLNLVIVIAGALAAMLNKRRKGAGGGEDDGSDPASTVVGEDDQTRRIQEEIRRKIAERRGQAAPEPAPTMPPVITPRPAVAREYAPSLRDRLEAKLEQARVREEAAARTRSLAMQEQTRKFESDEAAVLKIENAAHQRQVLALREAESLAVTTAAGVRAVWLTQLREPQQIRQAIVLREILGPPVGLQ
jgi:hypothetical protein